jgi:acetyl esterase/lipase
MNTYTRLSKAALFLLILAGTNAIAQQATEGFTRTANIVYGTTPQRELKMDLYLPASAGNPPLLVWVHGGAWRSGDKESVPVMAFLEEGYAIASLDFRLSGEAMFPAQVHDIKAAVRFLRGSAESLGINATRIALLGASSGGHLVALAAVSHGDKSMEGGIGDFLGQSSAVQAIVSYFGASNLTSILDQSTPFGLNVRKPALDLFIGGQPEDRLELARRASPVFQVDSADPPLLLLHGDQDPQMPINQSHELHYAYQQQGVEVQFEVVHGAAHGGAAFYDAQRNAVVLDFLNRHLRGGS